MTEPQLIDCHSHSAYSGHGSGTVAEMVARAEELGLNTFAQTEHLILPIELDPEHGYSMSDETTSKYLDELHALREDLKDRGSDLELIIGIEADWLDGRTDELNRLCVPYEYVLGSVHMIDNRPFDDPGDMTLWDEYGPDGVWKRYFETWLEMVSAPGPITSFSHPDLAKKFGIYPSFDLLPWYGEMASAVSASGRMVEVNTSGARKGVKEMYPAYELLKAFHDAGVDCTVGSDAHAPIDVAAGIRDAYDLMRRAGYDKVTVPKRDGDRTYMHL